MAPPKKYLTLEAKRLSVREKSKRYYERNRLQIRLRRRRARYEATTSMESCASKDSTVVNVKHITRLGKTNALEIQTRKKHLKHQANSPPSSKKPAPPPPLPLINLFLKLNAEANALQDKFNSFIQGMSISEYAESLLKAYFKSSSKRQGQIGVFVDPLMSLQALYAQNSRILCTNCRSCPPNGLSVNQRLHTSSYYFHAMATTPHALCYPSHLVTHHNCRIPSWQGTFDRKSSQNGIAASLPIGTVTRQSIT
ncbi:uncharacterized protein ARMOST_09784 [Armillaria ostoyae]|uniref:Uncharacterized protein n=1 Tax=Armillaria ostoyae TaxID=47428 RepID=A0A284RCG7_ARMOS|nr:uncharacterized protein ARMOST_09784 [Armillaria ostoyae]